MEFMYNLLIQPLVFLIDIIFVMLYDFFQEVSFIIVLLSIIVNFIALPLYRQADRIQKEQREKEKEMQPYVDHIKASFRGDERYMMLSAYYRVEKYNPASVLKESFPLLLQIPIFIAAYRYLSSAPVLIGATLGSIADLGSPDNLLRIGGVTVNILPILMTALNLLSGYVYSKNATLRQKIQVVGIALLFLVLLYNSPAGLVLYWTTSQVFSLVKNLILETSVFKKREVVLALSCAAILFSIVGMAMQFLANRAGVFTSEILLFLALVQISRTVLELKDVKMPSLAEKLQHIDDLLPDTGYTGLLALGFCCSLLFGLCIPSSVLSSSAVEFVDTSTGRFLTELITYPVTVYFGLFVVWCSVFFYFLGKKGRKVLFTLLLMCFGNALLNYFVFDVKPAFFYADLSFDGQLSITRNMAIINLVLSVIVSFFFVWIWRIKEKACRNAAGVIAVSLVVISAFNISKISASLKEDVGIINRSTEAVEENLDGVLKLSTTEKNVIVFMLDRALGSYVPYIFDEKPELRKAFDGFVYYPNTASFGSGTLIGAPPLYGGYEYAPAAIAAGEEANTFAVKRKALKVLPILFEQNGYDVTVADPPLFGTSNYDDCPGVTAIYLAGRFSKYDLLAKGEIEATQKRNFVMYSIFKTVPLSIREKVYDDGSYMAIFNSDASYTQAFLDNYSVLEELPDLTGTTSDGKGSFLFLQNSTTHEPVIMEPPDYELKPQKGHYEIPYGDREVDGRVLSINSLSSWKHYCVNLITYRELADWLNRLRELGVYDNTRIILVADHGITLSPAQFDDFLLENGDDIEKFNPLLMVKDFNSHGDMQINNEFMTNADVPVLAANGLIEDLVNPFTGNTITNAEKENEILIEKSAKRSKTSPEDKIGVNEIFWWEVRDSIFDQSNWKMVDGEDIR